MITITVLDRASAKLTRIPEKLRARVRARLIKRSRELVARIRGKLSGTVLKKRSGRLFNSISAELHESGTRLWIEAGSRGNVPYAGIHERGGKTRPHIIRPKNAQALHWVNTNGSFFAKVVHHPGSKMPRRRYIAASIWEMRGTLLRDAQDNKRGLWER